MASTTCVSWSAATWSVYACAYPAGDQTPAGDYLRVIAARGSRGRSRRTASSPPSSPRAGASTP